MELASRAARGVRAPTALHIQSNDKRDLPPAPPPLSCAVASLPQLATPNGRHLWNCHEHLEQNSLERAVHEQCPRPGITKSMHVLLTGPAHVKRYQNLRACASTPGGGSMSRWAVRTLTGRAPPRRCGRPHRYSVGKCRCCAPQSLPDHQDARRARQAQARALQPSEQTLAMLMSVPAEPEH